MALSMVLGEAGLTATRMQTKAVVLLEQTAAGFAIPAISLHLDATIPGTDDATFQRLAALAKANCPVSKLFNAEITLQANLLPQPRCNPANQTDQGDRQCHQVRPT